MLRAALKGTNLRSQRPICGFSACSHFMAVLAVLAVCSEFFFEITGLSVDHFGLLRRL